MAWEDEQEEPSPSHGGTGSAPSAAGSCKQPSSPLLHPATRQQGVLPATSSIPWVKRVALQTRPPKGVCTLLTGLGDGEILRTPGESRGMQEGSAFCRSESPTE